MLTVLMTTVPYFFKFYNTDLHVIIKQNYIKENDDSVQGARAYYQSFFRNESGS